jgi:ABC-type phosphate/phosphonate transport system substrate-binding protein
VIANARMYGVTAAAAQAWHDLLSQLARRARLPLEIIEHAAPAPISELWARRDMGAVFMCGLPFSRMQPRPYLLAAPVPSPVEFRAAPIYWSEFVVRSDSPYRAVSDTCGGRIAFTSPESQSGFAAPLQYLRQLGGKRPLYAEIIAPQITPQGALAAVIEHRADVAAIDAYSLCLQRRFSPELSAGIRVLARTEPRPIAPLVASTPLESLAQAFEQAHQDAALQPLLQNLCLQRFVRPDPERYQALRQEFEATLAYWRAQPLAGSAHPEFAELTPAADAE